MRTSRPQPSGRSGRTTFRGLCRGFQGRRRTCAGRVASSRRSALRGRLATTMTEQCVATRTAATGSAGEHQNDKQQDYDNRDDHRHRTQCHRGARRDRADQKLNDGIENPCGNRHSERVADEREKDSCRTFRIVRLSYRIPPPLFRVLCRVGVELRLAPLRAEIVRLALVLAGPCRFRRINLHSAYNVLFHRLPYYQLTPARVIS